MDLFSNQVVKISDQILSTFIFHKVFFDSSLLDFGLLVEHFIEFDSHFYDSINPLLETYDFTNIKDKLKAIINKYWPTLITKASHVEVMKVIKIFWFCCEIQSLLYIKKYIDNLPLPDEVNYSFDYDQNQMIFAATRISILVLLSEFRRSDPIYIKMAFELMILYIRKNPQEAGFFSYLMKEKYLFERTNYLYGDTLQHTLIDFLIDNIKKNGTDSIYIKIFFDVSANLLKTHFTDTESSGNRFHIYNFDLHPTESIKSLRNKIWQQLWKLYPTHKDSVYTVLLSLDYPKKEEEKDVWRLDVAMVLSLIFENLDYNDFRACEAAHRYFRIIEDQKITNYDKRLKRKASNRLFRLYNLFAREIRVDWRKNETIRQEKLKKYCQKFDLDAYVKLLDDLAYIKTVKNGYFGFESEISQIIADIALKDVNLFLTFMEHAIAKYDFDYHCYPILSSYFKAMPDDFEPILTCLERNAKNKPHWLLSFHVCIPDDLVKNNHRFLIEHFFSVIHNGTRFWSLNDIIDKYSNYTSKGELYQKTVTVLNTQIHKASISYIDPDFFIEAFDYCKDILDVFCPLYYKFKMSEVHYDYENKVLKQIVSYKSDEILNFIQTVYGQAHAGYTFKEKMCFIWELDNYEKVLRICIDHFMKQQNLWNKEEAISAFFTDLRENIEKARLFIRKMINEYYDNEDYINMIFLVIASCLGKYKCEYLQQYLILKPDFESFKKIHLFPLHGSYMGSRIPHIRSEIEKWEEIISAVKELSPAIEYLEHIEYLESHIDYCRRDIERVAKREFEDIYRS